LRDEVWVVVLGRVDSNFDRMFLNHISQTNVANVHRRKNLILSVYEGPRD
jgi:hypothetical protein